MTNRFVLFLSESSLIIAHCVCYVCSSTSQFGQLFLVNRFFILFVVVIISSSLLCFDPWSFTSESCLQRINTINTFHVTSSDYLLLCSSPSVRLCRHLTAFFYRRHHRHLAHRHPPAAAFYFYLTHRRIYSSPCLPSVSSVDLLEPYSRIASVPVVVPAAASSTSPSPAHLFSPSTVIRPPLFVLTAAAVRCWIRPTSFTPVHLLL